MAAWHCILPFAGPANAVNRHVALTSARVSSPANDQMWRSGHVDSVLSVRQEGLHE